MTTMNLVILSGMAGVITILIGVALNGSGKRQKQRERRAGVISNRARGKAVVSQDGKPVSVKKDMVAESRWLAILIRILPRRDNIQKALKQTGKSISISHFLLASAAIAIVIFAGMKLFAGLPGLLSVLTAFAVGPGLVWMVIRYWVSKRLNAFINQFPDAIDLMVRGLKSGLPIGEAMASIGREFTGPVGVEFRTITEAVRVGTPMDEALWQATERLPAQELKFFVISLSIQQDTGGNLGETLENLSDILRQRKQMKLKIKAMSSEARASAYILGSLPFLMFMILLLINPEYVLMLVYDPRGRMIMGIGLGFIAVGVAVMYKLVRFRI